MATFAPPKLYNFVLTERLGSGTYATVYKGYSKSAIREVVAIKCIAKKSLNQAATENLLVEIEILKGIKHPHIVELKDFQWDNENIYLIMEFCAGGDLSHFIRSRRRLPERLIRRFLQQLASALKLLYEQKIAHLDLKPQNLLLTSSTNPQLKVADFGFAQYMQHEDGHSLRGSPLYMAPEMVCSRHYDAKADLWSVGVILYEALFGQPPFASKSFTELEEKILSKEPIKMPPGVQPSPECCDLLYQLLQRRPEDRVSFPEFFQHTFIDLEHMASSQSLKTATSLLTRAVQKDKDGDVHVALALYRQGLEDLIPALHYESDPRRKTALRSKVSEYISRAEELKAVLVSDLKAAGQRSLNNMEQLKEMSKDNPRLCQALKLASCAIKHENKGMLHQALKMHRDSLGELIIMLEAEDAGRRKDLLHAEVQNLMARAEQIKEDLKMKESKASIMENEEFSDSIKNACSIQ
uniref:serine/threonine-protein kinase ULK3-like n=1 Tax=Myxine glutinosa TaxID=7769 RepID=UPI00358EDDFF